MKVISECAWISSVVELSLKKDFDIAISQSNNYQTDQNVRYDAIEVFAVENDADQGLRAPHRGEQEQRAGGICGICGQWTVHLRVYSLSLGRYQTRE